VSPGGARRLQVRVIVPFSHPEGWARRGTTLKLPLPTSSWHQAERAATATSDGVISSVPLTSPETSRASALDHPPRIHPLVMTPLRRPRPLSNPPSPPSRPRRSDRGGAREGPVCAYVPDGVRRLRRVFHLPERERHDGAAVPSTRPPQAVAGLIDARELRPEDEL